jgi:FtsH-binding integral membrane protein
MANFDQNRMQSGATISRGNAAIDQGLRSYMLSVYNYMAGGLAITGLVAYVVSQLAVAGSPDAAAAVMRNGVALTDIGVALYGSALKWVVMLAPLGLVFYLSARISKMSVSAAQISFWIFAGLMGLSLSSIFLIYTANSITQTFFVTAIAFGGLSLYGYTTKRDLTAMGSFLIMGVIGLIVASLVNIFLQSSALQFAVSVLGVLIFAGLTAYDTQRIKEMYYVGDAMAVAAKKAIMGALSLYLDFVNMFMFLLQFMGNRR